MLKRKKIATKDCIEGQNDKELLRACPFLEGGDIQTATLFIKVNYKLMRIRLKDIDLIEGLDDYVRIHVHPRPVLVLMTLKALVNMLPAKEFVRINRSYIVPINKIEGFDKTKVRVVRKEIRIGISYTNAYNHLLTTNMEQRF